jgi:hypothetical protein
MHASGIIERSKGVVKGKGGGYTAIAIERIGMLNGHTSTGLTTGLTTATG